LKLDVKNMVDDQEKIEEQEDNDKISQIPEHIQDILSNLNSRRSTISVYPQLKGTLGIKFYSYSK